MRPSDRIRRILSDGAPPPARRGAPVLREVPPERPPESDEDEPTPISPTLRERLSVLERLSRRAGPLRVDAPTTPPPDAGHGASPAEGKTVVPPPSDPAEPGGGEVPLESLVGGSLRETDAGTCWQVDRRYTLSEHHGAVQLRDALDHPVRLRPNERGPGGSERLDLARAVFLDTETTGLSGGTGTVAFLVGAGWLEGDTFLVRQYFMRDYPEEAGLLQAVRDDLGDRPLVSFNGRSYDWPLLLTRWKLSRTRWDAPDRTGHMPSPWSPGPRAHLDLLPIARRLWSRTLHSRSLGTIERHVLGLARHDDLPSASIPAAYFHYLRTGYSHAMARAFRHNQIDIVSMLALVARVAGIVTHPEAQTAHPGDALGTAKLLLDLGEPEAARRCLESRLPESSGKQQPEMRRVLATLCRKAGDVDAALVHWKALATNPRTFDREAYEHVAKVYEHTHRDFATALQWTQEALARARPTSAAHEALTHREARLLRRAGRAG